MRRDVPLLCPASMTILLIAVFLVGCGGSEDNAMTAGRATAVRSTAGPMADSAATSAPPTLVSVELPMLGPTVIDVPAKEVAKASISKSGGVVEYGPVRVEVPAGAVASETSIVIARLSRPFHKTSDRANDSDAVVAVSISSFYDFGPSGLRFNRPVTVTLPYDLGMGPDGIDPERIAVAFWNGERWMAVKGTVDPDTRTVSVRVTEFRGSLLNAVLLIVGAGMLIDAAVDLNYGEEGTDTDPVIDGKANAWIKHKDPVIQDQANKAVIQHEETGETKSLDDPHLASWLASLVEGNQHAALAYEGPNGTTLRSDSTTARGSNWRDPVNYFTGARGEVGPLQGDCTDTTNAAVSVLRAKGFRAKGVYGYGGGDTDRPHAWGEVLIGDKLYRIDDRGGLTDWADPNNFNVKEYEHITDEDDPRYQSMYDEKGQKPYDPQWWHTSDFVGTYKGLFDGGPSYGDIPFEFTVDEYGAVQGRIPEFYLAAPAGPPYGVKWTGSFAGRVSQGGRLEGSGDVKVEVTYSAGTKGETGNFEIAGTIDRDGAFIGTMTGKTSAEAEAKRE